MAGERPRWWQSWFRWFRWFRSRTEAARLTGLLGVEHAHVPAPPGGPGPAAPAGPRPVVISAGEALVEATVRATVRGTQEKAEQPFAEPLHRAGVALVDRYWDVLEATRQLGAVVADDQGRTAKEIADRKSDEALESYDERHEPGGTAWLVRLLVPCAFLADLVHI